MSQQEISQVPKSQETTEKNGFHKGWLQTRENQEVFQMLEAKLPKVLGIFDKLMDYEINMTVRFHGKANSGKSAVIRSLCRSGMWVLSSDIVLEAKKSHHFDTPGLSITEALFPCMYDRLKWLHLEMVCSGELAEERYDYLYYNPKDEKYDCHFVVFSMTDYSSFQFAKSVESSLQEERVILIGTKVDRIDKYQVTSMELEGYVQESNRTLVLVNSMVPMVQEGVNS